MGMPDMYSNIYTNSVTASPHPLCQHCHYCNPVRRHRRRSRDRRHTVLSRMSKVIPESLQSWFSGISNSTNIESVAKGLNGFEELRKYIKQGSEFCKEVALIIHERADYETNYAKGLSKLSNKLTKAATGNLGTLVDGWRAVAALMEQEAELHKNLGAALLEEISKPLRSLVDQQHRARKPIESAVDKSLKNLTDKRSEEYKAKKTCYTCAKENEKGNEARTDSKNGKGKHSEKDMLKLDKKCESTAKQLKKADKDYCELCERAETARQEWEFSVSKGSSQLQILEEERMSKLAEYLNQYNSHVSVMGPRLTQNCDRLHEAVISVDLQGDLRNVAQSRGSSSNMQEQILFDCYAEDMQFTMNAERRKNALQNYLLYLRQALEREKKGKEGVIKLVEVYKERPNFADQDAQEDTKQRLSQVLFTINFLEASHFKIANVMAKLECQQKLTHKFEKYIETSRDKQGLLTSVMKLPVNLASEGNSGYDVTSVTVGALASQVDHYEEPFDDDEFDDVEGHTIGRCKVMYEYNAAQSDELTIRPGEILNLYEKQPDGWWQGELHGRVGIFPATYVEEI